MDIRDLERRERESLVSAAAAPSNEARIAHEGLARGYADRLARKNIVEAPLQVTEVDGAVLLSVPGQAATLLSCTAASATADSLTRGAFRAGRRKS